MDHRVFLMLLFVLCGAFNVLIIKWSGNQLVECSDGKMRRFQHPVVLTLLMFLGELLCFGVYKLLHLVFSRRGLGAEQENLLTRGSNELPTCSMLLPTFLDAVASILLFTGLYLTYATSFQMIRCVSLIFVGLFSTIYLNNTLSTQHWLAIFTITCGIVDIVAMDVQRITYDQETLTHTDHNAIITGDMLIIIAEVLHAFQYVYEEKHLKALDLVPMHVAGWQGIFGVCITLLSYVCLNFIPSATPFNENSRGVFDDLTDLWPQLRSNVWIVFALLAFTLSCAIYNYVGLAIAKFSSSGNRLLADSLRVYFIWIFVLLAEWEYINIITIMGFILLQMGIISYRHAIFTDWYRAVLARWQRSRYVDLNVDAGSPPSSRPADVI